MARVRRFVQRRIAGFALRVRARACGGQRTHNVGVAARSSNVQRRGSVPVCRIDINAAVQGLLRPAQITLRRRPVQVGLLGEALSSESNGHRNSGRTQKLFHDFPFTVEAELNRLAVIWYFRETTATRVHPIFFGLIRFCVFAFRPGYRRPEAAPRPIRSRRGLHPHLRGQHRPNALHPLPEARPAGRIRHRGKHLQAHRRESVQTVGMPLAESARQRCARHRMLPRKHAVARLPRLEGLPRGSRLTKEDGEFCFSIDINPLCYHCAMPNSSAGQGACPCQSDRKRLCDHAGAP